MLSKKIVAMFTVMCMVLSMVIHVSAENMTYSDVTPNHWAYESIKKMNESGVMIGKGTSNGVVFDPNGTITGAEMYMTAYRIAGMPTELPKLDYEIKNELNTWYSDALTWCMYNGLAYIEYVQFSSTPQWWEGDEPIYSTYVSSGRVGSTVRPINPKGYSFRTPLHDATGLATRTDVVLLLYYYVITYLGVNATESADLRMFSDYDPNKVKSDESGRTVVGFCNSYGAGSYSSETVHAWEWAVGSDIIKGCGDGTLQMGEYDTETRGHRYVTRAEYATILDRFIEYLESLR